MRGNANLFFHNDADVSFDKEPAYSFYIDELRARSLRSNRRDVDSIPCVTSQYNPFALPYLFVMSASAVVIGSLALSGLVALSTASAIYLSTGLLISLMEAIWELQCSVIVTVLFFPFMLLYALCKAIFSAEDPVSPAIIRFRNVPFDVFFKPLLEGLLFRALCLPALFFTFSCVMPAAALYLSVFCTSMLLGLARTSDLDEDYGYARIIYDVLSEAVYDTIALQFGLLTSIALNVLNNIALSFLYMMEPGENLLTYDEVAVERPTISYY
jgi:hypothetical protein